MPDGFELFDLEAPEETEEKTENKPENKKSNMIIIILSALVAVLSVCVALLMVDKLSGNNYKIIVVDTNADRYNQVQIVESEEELSEVLSLKAEITTSQPAADTTKASSASQEKATTSAASSQQSTPSQSSKININTASAYQLTSLKGIGEKKAQAIIDYRNENGAFSSIDEIKKVSGIGDKIFEGIKDYITVG